MRRLLNLLFTHNLCIKELYHSELCIICNPASGVLGTRPKRKKKKTKNYVKMAKDQMESKTVAKSKGDQIIETNSNFVKSSLRYNILL